MHLGFFWGVVAKTHENFINMHAEGNHHLIQGGTNDDLNNLFPKYSHLVLLPNIAFAHMSPSLPF